MISHGSSEATRERAKMLGFGECLTDSCHLMSNADVIIVAIRPQDALALPRSGVKRAALVISFMAGLPIDLLEMVFGQGAKRMMCSGPDTILSGRGVAAAYPADDRAIDVVRMMGMRAMSVGSEEELDSFTVGICIPPILLNIAVREEEVLGGMKKMESRYPVYGQLSDWMRDVMRESPKDRDACLENVSTKGGISEAMTSALKSGSTFEAALSHGMERGREITAEVRKNILLRHAANL
jgi:pyrroline-5-carboxylate reductase